MAARPDEPHPAACDLYRQFAELVPEAPAEIASFVLPLFEASSDYVEAMALPGVQPSAAAFAALLQAECNVTAWSLEAAALDEDARARLVSQAFGRTEEQQEELLALKRLFGALSQDVVDFCASCHFHSLLLQLHSPCPLPLAGVSLLLIPLLVLCNMLLARTPPFDRG